jgi:hypothetical protein
VSACDGIKGNKPTELLLGLSSHISLNEARQRIQVGADNWRRVEDTKTAPGDKRPPYHLVVATIPNVKSYRKLPRQVDIQVLNTTVQTDLQTLRGEVGVTMGGGASRVN